MKKTIIELVSTAVFFFTVSGIAYVTNWNLTAILIAAAGMLLTDIVRFIDSLDD